MKYFIKLMFLLLIANFANAQTLVPITSNMVTTSGNMPTDPMQFFDGNVNTPISLKNASSTLTDIIQYTGAGCSSWVSSGLGGFKCGLGAYLFKQTCTFNQNLTTSELDTFAKNIGSLNTGSTLVIDFQKTKNINKVNLLNLLFFNKPNNGLTYNFSGDIVIVISTSSSPLGPWIEVGRQSFNCESLIDKTDSLETILINNASRYWQIQIIDFSSLTLNVQKSFKANIVRTLNYSGSPEVFGIMCSNTDTIYQITNANLTSNVSFSNSGINIGEIQFYEQPLININGTAVIPLGQCDTLTAATTGAAYQWSTGDTSRSIVVCNAGTYTVTATDTSFNGNNDYTASFSVSTKANEYSMADSMPTPNGDVYAVFKQGNNIFLGGNFTQVGNVTGSGAQIDATTGLKNATLPRIVGTVNTVIADGNGGWYVGGVFTQIGTAPINNLAHIKSNYTLDLNFMPQPNDAVNTLALNGGYLYVGGAFTTIQGYTNNYLAKIDPSTGAPVFWNANVNGTVNSILFYANTLVVGGNFTSLGGSNLNNLGALDTTYVQATTWNPNPNGEVKTVYVSGSKLYAGGNFTTVSGVNHAYAAGFTLPTFTTDKYNIGANGEVNGFMLYNNLLYVSGAFTQIGGSNIPYLAQLNKLNGLANVAFKPNPNGTVNGILLYGGNLLVNGSFSSIGGSSLNDIAQLNLTTGAALAWNPNFTALSGNSIAINAMALNGKNLFVGGNFNSVGSTAINYLAQIDATTSKVTTWNANVNGLVRAIYADSNYLYIGGDFTTVNGTITKNHIAQLRLSTGVATAWNPSADGSVYAIAKSGTNLFVGGSFSTIGGIARANLASVNTATGAALSSFNPSPNGAVNALAIGGDSVYIGGTFTAIGGQTRNRVASYKISTSALTTIDPNANSDVNALAFFNNKLYIGGTFTSISNSLQNYFGEYDVVGNALTSFNPEMLAGTAAAGNGLSTLFAIDSSLYQGGGFSYSNCNKPMNNLTALNLTNQSLGYWQTQPDNVIRSIYATKNKVYVGGSFKFILDRYQPYFASLDVFDRSGTVPIIDSVSSSLLCGSDSLTVYGSSFSSTISVSIAGIQVPYNVLSANIIKLSYPLGVTGAVTVSNPLGSATSAKQVTFLPQPNIPVISANGSTTFCKGGSVILNCGATGICQWYKNGGSIKGATNSNYTVSTGGIYGVKVTNGSGCSSDIATDTVVVNSGTNSTTYQTSCGNYVWNGTSYSTSGSYTIHLTNSVGCDSAATLVLTLKSNTTSSTNASICAGGSYTFNGTAYTKAGTYIAHLTNAVGCDSAATLNLTVKAISTSTTNASICVGVGYTFNGATYTTAGTYVKHLTNSVGCDSIATLILTIKATSTSTTNASICAGGSYTFNGTTYTSAGIYVKHLTNAVGCDSTATLNLSVKSPTTSTTNASICAGSSYTFNGTNYTKAGIYIVHLINAVGCDSAATLNLTVKATSASTTNASICIGGSYTFNGTAYTKAGTYTAHLTNAVGCDSAATLILTIKATSASTTNASICAGSSYTFNGTAYTSAGTYKATLTNIAGCDSVASLILTIKATSVSTTSASIKLGDSYLFNGTSYTTSGTYTAHLTNSVGCDSIATLVLSVKNPTSSTVTASICSGNSYLFNGTSYTTTGTYTAHLTNAAGGDSIVTLVLVVNKPSNSNTNASICSGSSYTFNGSTYTNAGTYVKHLTNSVGCDSVATLNLKVIATSASTTNASICTGGSYTFNGSTYTKAGSYTTHLTNSLGCDSTATLVLTVKKASASTTNASICIGSSYTFNGNTYTSAGSYTAHLTNAVGCDSVATLVLVIKSATTSITDASICNGGSYTFNGTIYNNSGTYTVHLTNTAGCDSTATLNLTVKSTSTSATNASICLGGSYTFNGYVYSVAGSYTAHLTNSVGCDSTANLVLAVKAPSTSTTNASICAGGSYAFNGTTYTKAGAYIAHLTNSVGCDSAATLNLSVKVTSTSTTNASICAGGSYAFNGNNYTKAGTYVAHLTNAVGCDSTATLNLTVKATSVSTTNASICAGGSYTFNGSTYLTAGTYVSHLINAVGCDSTATLNLIVKSNSKDTIIVTTASPYTWHGTTYTKSGVYTFDTLNSAGCDSLTTLILTSTLPISFKDFIAYSKINTILLNWHTSTELNTNHFVIQHSIDGTSFANIGSVNAIGTDANNYEFTDKNPANGSNYYRLQSVDKNGAISYSKVISVQFANASNRFTVYPNPVKNVLTISGEHIAKVQVLDNMGRIINTQSLHDATNPLIIVERLSTGVYHLRIQTTDGKSSTVGFIKQ